MSPSKQERRALHLRHAPRISQSTLISPQVLPTNCNSLHALQRVSAMSSERCTYTNTESTGREGGGSLPRGVRALAESLPTNNAFSLSVSEIGVVSSPPQLSNSKRDHTALNSDAFVS